MTVAPDTPPRPRSRIERIEALFASGLVVLVALGVALADALLAMAAFAGEVTPAAALAGHLIVTAAAFGANKHWLGTWSYPAIIALWTCLLGPVGAVVSTLAILHASRTGARSIEEEAWCQRLSGIEEPGDGLVTAIRDDRAYRGDSVDLRSFGAVMADGTVSEKQTVLGLIAQDYDPAYAGLLMDALRSPQVAVRASAAAVLANLRDGQAADLKASETLALSADYAEVLEAANRFRRAAASGLLSPQDAAKARRRADALRRQIHGQGIVPLAVHQLADPPEEARRHGRREPLAEMPKAMRDHLARSSERAKTRGAAS